MAKSGKSPTHISTTSSYTCATSGATWNIVNQQIFKGFYWVPVCMFVVRRSATKLAVSSKKKSDLWHGSSGLTNTNGTKAFSPWQTVNVAIGADGEVAPDAFIFFRKSGDGSAVMWNTELKGNIIPSLAFWRGNKNLHHNSQSFEDLNQHFHPRTRLPLQTQVGRVNVHVNTPFSYAHTQRNSLSLLQIPPPPTFLSSHLRGIISLSNPFPYIKWCFLLLLASSAQRH